MHLLHHCKILLIASIPVIVELIEEFGNHKAQNIGKGKGKGKEKEASTAKTQAQATPIGSNSKSISKPGSSTS